jgi:DNA-binding NarL/FixJ family response regulator
MRCSSRPNKGWAHDRKDTKKGLPRAARCPARRLADEVDTFDRSSLLSQPSRATNHRAAHSGLRDKIRQFTYLADRRRCADSFNGQHRRLRVAAVIDDRERPGKDGIKVSGPISVLIAEDSLLVRDSVHRALSTDADVTVVGVAEDYDSAVELVEKHQPTMLVTDVRMPPTSTDEGIRLARWMRTAHPDTGVIVLSQYADPCYASGLLDGGTAARGYLLKERVSHFEQLSEAVHQVAAGGTVLDPLVVEALLAQPSSAATLSRLTPREREVLGELATGFSNRTVAQRLVLSQRAVEKHINAIFAKLGLTIDDSVDRRVKAVLMFLNDRTSA